MAGSGRFALERDEVEPLPTEDEAEVAARVLLVAEAKRCGRPAPPSLLALGLCLVGAALFAWNRKSACEPTGALLALQGKSAFDIDAQLARKASSLKSIKNRSLADGIVLGAMRSAGQDYAEHFSAHEVRKLPESPADAARSMLTVAEVREYRQKQKNDDLQEARHAQCAFNVIEAFVSAMGMGDDINAIIRTCPTPRDGESELACQINGGILVAWVGNLATKLSLAASNCAMTTNVDAFCAAGVTGLVSAMGELAAAASLGAATCVPVLPSLTTSKVSVLGDQTLRGGRRLLVGEGPVGSGIQCGINVGMVAVNIANLGLAINFAVNTGNCGWKSLTSPLNKLTGVPEALCTVDIGGAVAYMSQVVTFVNLIVIHCSDFLDASALCGASISGIITAAAAVAPYGAAVHAACRQNHVTSNPDVQSKINGLYDVPTLGRRLEHEKLSEAMAKVNDIRAQLERELNFSTSALKQSQGGHTPADLSRLLHLMEGPAHSTEKSSSSGWPFAQECAD